MICIIFHYFDCFHYLVVWLVWVWFGLVQFPTWQFLHPPGEFPFVGLIVKALLWFKNGSSLLVEACVQQRHFESCWCFVFINSFISYLFMRWKFKCQFIVVAFCVMALVRWGGDGVFWDFTVCLFVCICVSRSEWVLLECSRIRWRLWEEFYEREQKN